MLKIIHIDMDCFFAAVEMRDNPNLAGQPLAVGGPPHSRSVISAANYEARAYGVRSGQASFEAVRRCPKLILIEPNFQKYRDASRHIRQIFEQYSYIIEPLSLDEAFLDVTNPKQNFKTATLMAKAIREQIFRETNLTSSAGIAPNPFLAKVASDWNKPNGQFTITPDMIPHFVFDLPLKKIPGVGQVTNEKLNKMGFHTCGDLQTLSLQKIYENFGKWGARLHDLCRGIDNRVLGLRREPKSLSVERTFAKDLFYTNEIYDVLPNIFSELKRRILKIDQDKIKHVFVKIKFANFISTTVEDISLPQVNLDSYQILLSKARDRSTQAVRLIGIGVRLREQRSGPMQLELFTHLR